MLDDEELIRRISKKDSEAFEQFVLRYQSKVLNLCYGLLDDYQQAEEAAQDVFVQIFQKALTFRHESKVSSWVYRIAVNRSLNLIRHEKKLRWMKKAGFTQLDGYQTEKIPIEPYKDEPGALFEQKEAMQSLRKAIDNLSNKQKTVFILNQFEGLSIEEISEILKVSVNTVEVRIHRAKRKLRHILTGQIKKTDKQKKL
ncbi:MAG: RNA polymerase sigma factor [Candidatus Aminicenantes bacterium]|nr:RNA polymerase sigma factor [Candidatus Aminicenantes bacterium]